MADSGASADFTDLYNRHVDTVYRVCYTLLRNKADAEDATQNVFIKLLAKPKAFQSEQHERAWLIRVASNYCKDVLKSSWAKRTNLDAMPEPITTDEEIDETLTEVLKLPENLRICIYLYYYEGYSTAEMAEMIQKTNSTVRNYLSDARKQLRERLAVSLDD